MASRIIRRAVAALAATALAAGLIAPVASAHVQVVKTNPAGSAKTSQRSVSILFSGPIRSGTLKVFGPDGSKVSKGSGGRDPRNVDRLLAGLKSGLKAGSYTAKATWIAADGHHQEAAFGFKLTK